MRRAYALPFVALACAAVLSGCGFEPLYGGHQARRAYADIGIGNIPDRDGHYLRNRLIDALYTGGYPHDPRLSLDIAPLDITLTDLGIQKDATVTRTGVEIATQLTLTERSSGKVLLRRDMRAVGGYDVLDQQYATLVTRQNVKERTLDELSRNIVTELDLYFHRRPATP